MHGCMNTLSRFILQYINQYMLLLSIHGRMYAWTHGHMDTCVHVSMQVAQNTPLSPNNCNKNSCITIRKAVKSAKFANEKFFQKLSHHQLINIMTRILIPNSTQIPDVIIDQWMCELSGAELKVILYIARRTFGFGKESDNVSLNQIASGIKKRDGRVLDRGTGLSVSSVARALKSLEEQNILIRKTNINDKNEHEENTYSLNLNWSWEVLPNSENLPPKSGSGYSQNRRTSTPKIGGTRNTARNRTRNSSNRIGSCCCCFVGKFHTAQAKRNGRGCG